MRKGNITLIIALFIMVLSVLAAGIFSKINASISLSAGYDKIMESNIKIGRVMETAFAYLGRTGITTTTSVQFEGVSVKYIPLKFENGLNPDYNDPEFYRAPTEVHHYGKMDLANTKSFNVSEYKDYIFFIDGGELRLFAYGTYNLGKSENGIFLLKRTTVVYYGLGEYNFVDYKGASGEVIGLAEWNPYKFNGLYKIEISDGESVETLVVHKAGNHVYFLTKK